MDFRLRELLWLINEEGRRGDGCLQFVVYAVAAEMETNRIRFVKRADTCTDNSFSLYSLAPGPYHVFALSITESEGDRVQSSGTRFQHVADDHLQLMEKAVTDFKDTDYKPIEADQGKTFGGVVPIVLGTRRSQSARHLIVMDLG